MKNKKSKPIVAIIMGSITDAKIMQQAEDSLNLFAIPFSVEIVSAHRTPDQMTKFAKEAVKNGFKIIIAGAGGAAHLPGMVACHTVLPVIGVPINVTSLNGLDALMSIAQMPKGIPVACVAVDNAFNAGLLAARILGIEDLQISLKLSRYQEQQKKKVAKMNLKIRK